MEGKKEYWSVVIGFKNEISICSKHKTSEGAFKASNKCEGRSGQRHKIYEVRLLKKKEQQTPEYKAERILKEYEEAYELAYKIYGDGRLHIPYRAALISKGFALKDGNGGNGSGGKQITSSFEQDGTGRK